MRQHVRGFGSEGVFEVDSHFGWPVRHRRECLSYEDEERAVGDTWSPPAPAANNVLPPPTVANRWSLPLLAFNALFGVLVVIASGVVVELRLRRRFRTQFTLAGIGILTATIAVMTLASIHWRELNLALIAHDIWLCGDFGHAEAISWPLLALPLLGTICLLYLGLSLIFSAIGRVLRSLFHSQIEFES